MAWVRRLRVPSAISKPLWGWGALVCWEDELNILSQLAPCGAMPRVRKILSYEGAIRIGRTGLRDKNDGAYRDPTNYVYGVLLRSIGLCGTKCKWSNNKYANVYNDETLGDIFEAVLGVAYRKRKGLDLPTLTFNIEHIEEFAELIEIGVRNTESIVRITSALGTLENSRALAARLA